MSETARWKHSPPKQARGQQTQDRILDAVEELLETRKFEDITIHDLTTRAGTTTGSFYARFGSKEALLPVLYERYHAEMRREIEGAADPGRWAGLDVRQTIRRLVSLAIRLPRRRPWRLRTVSLFARAHPEAVPPDAVTRSRDAYAAGATILERHSEALADPDVGRSAAFILYVVITAARERMSFPETPLASALPHDDDEFQRELERLAQAYLTTPVVSEEG